MPTQLAGLDETGGQSQDFFFPYQLNPAAQYAMGVRSCQVMIRGSSEVYSNDHELIGFVWR